MIITVITLFDRRTVQLHEFHINIILLYYKRKVTGLTTDEVIGFFISIHTILPAAQALGLAQPLTEMNTRNLSGRKVRPTRKAHKLTAIYQPIV
jgi:hypothetical protein